jgi:predicted CxxxxCH...CXXCH cytochrome family protein
VSFSGDAVADGFSASYDPTSQTCTVYCHGTVDQGGVATQPAWTDNQGGACNRCHGFAPPSPHPQNTACGSCHPSSPAALDATHLNGVLDL